MIELVVGVVLVALCGYRLAWLVSEDDISEPLRMWVYRRAYPGAPITGGTDDAYTYRASRGWGWVYRGLSCPLCTGVWATAGSWWAWHWWPTEWARPLVALGAAMGIAAFLARKS